MARSATKFQWIAPEDMESIREALAPLKPVVRIVEKTDEEEFLDIDFNREIEEDLKIIPKKGGLSVMR